VVVSQNGRQLLRRDLEGAVADEQQVTTVRRRGERFEQSSDRIADRPPVDRSDEGAVRRELQAEESE
jgi:hypothetical protein